MTEKTYIIKYIKAVKLPVKLKLNNYQYFNTLVTMGDQQSSMDAHPIYQVSLSTILSAFFVMSTIIFSVPFFQRTEYMPRPEFSPETVRVGFDHFRATFGPVNWTGHW